jgi:hypothetical protein
VECSPETAKRNYAEGHEKGKGQIISNSTVTSTTVKPFLPASTTRETITPHEVLSIGPHNISSHTGSDESESGTSSKPLSGTASSTYSNTSKAQSKRELLPINSNATTGSLLTEEIDEMNFTMCRKDYVIIPDQYNGES